jgi:hypothetical protein
MSTGPERRDESVSFSLKELMKLEDERVGQEREVREARERAAESAREETARRARAELEARERAEADERERARFREMEEAARHEAMQRAAVEQARITVEARTRAEEAERERSHERELLRMRAETTKKPGPGGFIGSALGGAAFAVAAALLLHFAVWRPEADKRVAELGSAAAAADGRADELGRRVDDQKERIAQLEKSLRETQAELAIRKAPPAPKAPTGPSSAPRSGTAASHPKTPNVNDGPPCLNKFDPLCGHIDTH